MKKIFFTFLISLFLVSSVSADDNFFRKSGDYPITGTNYTVFSNATKNGIKYTDTGGIIIQDSDNAGTIEIIIGTYDEGSQTYCHVSIFTGTFEGNTKLVCTNPTTGRSATKGAGMIYGTSDLHDGLILDDGTNPPFIFNATTTNDPYTIDSSYKTFDDYTDYIFSLNSSQLTGVGAGPNLTCTTEEIPNFDFIDIHPTATGSINEVIQTPAENTYAYSTSLNIENDLQVIFLGIEDVAGFSQFVTQSGSMTFGTVNSTIFSEYESVMSINTSALISSIKLGGSYGPVNLYIYDELGSRVVNTIEALDLVSYDDSTGYPIGASASRVDVQFQNGFFDKTISDLQVFSIGANETKTVEVCQDDDTGEYSVDGDSYTGNPYTDLVGTPTPADITFSDNGFEFFSNGFCLSDFRPFPSGGTLIFDISNPDSERRSTYPLKSTGLYQYGVGNCSKITTNYHNLEGRYYVRPVYIYQNIKYYPKGESYFPYDITEPEEIDNGLSADFWDDDKCGGDPSDSGFLPGISSFFSCLSQTTGTFIGKISGAVGSIGDLFNAIGSIGDVDEQKTLNEAYNRSNSILGIPTTHAIDTYTYDPAQDPFTIISQGSFESIPLLNNIYNLIKYSVIASILLGVMLVLFPNILKRDD